MMIKRCTAAANTLGIGCLALLALSYLASASCDSAEDSAVGDLRLNYLGTVDGKRYFAGDNMTTWDEARRECETFLMKMATINSTAELEFLKPLMWIHGPWWFGARDIGRKSMYVWFEHNSAPPESAEPIPDYINFYHWVEEGPMAIIMSPAHEVCTRQGHKKPFNHDPRLWEPRLLIDIGWHTLRVAYERMHKYCRRHEYCGPGALCHREVCIGGDPAEC